MNLLRNGHDINWVSNMVYHVHKKMSYFSFTLWVKLLVLYPLLTSGQVAVMLICLEESRAMSVVVEVLHEQQTILFAPAHQCINQSVIYIHNQNLNNVVTFWKDNSATMQRHNVLYLAVRPSVRLPPTKDEAYAIARDVCMSVCLSVSKITQIRVHGFGWNLACRQVSRHGRTDQLLSPIRIIVRMPEPENLKVEDLSKSVKRALRAGYRSRDALHRDTVYSTL